MGILSGALLQWQSWSSSKELVEKILWTLDSFATPAPTYGSARTPVVVQASFQKKQPQAFLSSFQCQLKHVFQEKHPIAM